MSETVPTDAPPAESIPPALSYAPSGVPPRVLVTRSLTHGGVTIGEFTGMQATAALFPLMAGLLLYGWRALLSIGVVMLAATGAVALWRRVGARGQHVRYGHALWSAMLLALLLPPHMLSDAYPLQAGEAVLAWPLLVAAGVMLVMLIWALGGIGSGRVHPVLVTYLFVFVLFHELLVPHHVLQRDHLFTGDVLDSGDPAKVLATREPWLAAPVVPGQHAVRLEPASQRLTFYTTGIEKPERSFLSLEALLRDRMPPLEDLIIGGQPGPIGTSCAVATIIGGLFLLYRGAIDYRIPLLIVLTAYLCLLVLPVPVVIREASREWRWLAIRDPAVGWPVGLTFANYEMMASPLLFTAFFLATGTAVRPMGRRSRAVYAVLIGALAAAFQLYFSVAIGPYLALLTVSLLTPTVDKWLRPRTLV